MGHPPMVVRAANLAFGHLGRDLLPTNTDVREARHLRELRAANVIEVEDPRIGLTAVDAGVLQEVVT